jgi:hypothetical protein
MSPSPPCTICKLNSPVALDRVLIIADCGDGTSTIGSAGRVSRPRGLSRVEDEAWGGRRVADLTPPFLGPRPGAFFPTRNGAFLLAHSKGFLLTRQTSHVLEYQCYCGGVLITKATGDGCTKQRNGGGKHRCRH